MLNQANPWATCLFVLLNRSVVLCDLYMLTEDVGDDGNSFDDKLRGCCVFVRIIDTTLVMSAATLCRHYLRRRGESRCGNS